MTPTGGSRDATRSFFRGHRWLESRRCTKNSTNLYPGRMRYALTSPRIVPRTHAAGTLRSLRSMSFLGTFCARRDAFSLTFPRFVYDKKSLFTVDNGKGTLVHARGCVNATVPRILIKLLGFATKSHPRSLLLRLERCQFQGRKIYNDA